MSPAAARIRIAIVSGAAAAILLAAVLLPPIAQPIDYHRFADTRALAGIPNFWNVVSNLAILAAGIAGLVFVLPRWGFSSRGKRGPTSGDQALAVPAARWPYIVLFTGFVLTAFGSAYYHWAPDNARLVWDRLPMTIGFMGLLAAMIAERISAPAGSRLLLPLALAGVASVSWWQWTMARGADDVGPYAAVQFGSIALVLLIAMLFPRPATARAGIAGVGVCYAAAKLAEMLDDRILALGGVLSGHTVKHLLVGAAGLFILRMALAHRRVRDSRDRHVPARAPIRESVTNK